MNNVFESPFHVLNEKRPKKNSVQLQKSFPKRQSNRTDLFHLFKYSQLGSYSSFNSVITGLSREGKVTQDRY